MSRSVRIDLSEVDQLAKDLAERPVEVRREIGKALTRHVQQMQSRIEASVPRGVGPVDPRDKVRLFQSIERNRRRQLSGVVWSNTRAAFFQEHGTSRHAPRPSFGPALEFQAPLFEAEVADIASRPL